MSIPISRLKPVQAGLDDYFVVVQGTPAVARRAKLRDILDASGASSGSVGTVPVLRGPLHINDLEATQTVYTNDLMFVDQGTPPITRSVTVAQVLAASTTGPANTELSVAVNRSKLISGLPVAVAAYTDDWHIVNQGNPPITCRTRIVVEEEPPPSTKSPGWMTDILSLSSTPLHANEGIGSYQDFISPPGVTIQHETYAGIEDYAGETIVWTPTWVPTVSDPSPTVTPQASGKVLVYWDTVGGGWPKTSQGVLTLECTVDGQPGAGAIEFVSGPGGDYTRMTWGPVP